MFSQLHSFWKVLGLASVALLSAASAAPAQSVRPAGVQYSNTQLSSYYYDSGPAAWYISPVPVVSYPVMVVQSPAPVAIAPVVPATTVSAIPAGSNVAAPTATTPASATSRGAAASRSAPGR